MDMINAFRYKIKRRPRTVKSCTPNIAEGVCKSHFCGVDNDFSVRLSSPVPLLILQHMGYNLIIWQTDRLHTHTNTHPYTHEFIEIRTSVTVSRYSLELFAALFDLMYWIVNKFCQQHIAEQYPPIAFGFVLLPLLFKISMTEIKHHNLRTPCCWFTMKLDLQTAVEDS